MKGGGILETDEYYMKLAIASAKEGIDKNEFPFGCCIVLDNGEFVVTSNSCYTDKNPIKHAEIKAIEEMCNRLNQATLENAVIYTTTIPCLMCLGAISWAKIPRLVYGLTLQESINYGFDEVNYDLESIISKFPYELQINKSQLHLECLKLYNEWKNKNKILKWLQQAKKRR